MSEIISREVFEDLMKRNKFAIDNNGQVVCDQCRGDCGQCGAGGQMWQCQQYVDSKPHEFKTTGEGTSMMLLGIMSAILSVGALLFG